MSGTKRSLSSLYTLLADNTAGDISAQDVRDLAASTFLLDSTETSITGTATATLDAMHVCSGTSVDYTVTLPTAVGNAGRMMAFRMSNALTRLVTLDGNASETIDGATTRIMWAGESATLISDGSQWLKIAGRSKPFYSTMRLITTNQSISTGVSTKVNLNESYEDTLSLNSVAGSSITPKRSGKYIVAGQAGFANTTSGPFQVHVYINGSLRLFGKQNLGVTENPSPFVIVNIDLTSGQAVELYARHDQGSNRSVEANSSFLTTYLSILEVPTW